MKELLKTLTDLNGISGRETAVCDYLRAALQEAPAVSEITTDRIGNCIVKLKGNRPAAHTVLLAAHMEEVGGIVTGITEEGYLRFAAVGGVLPAVLYARRVAVNGHIGVIAGKAFHQCSEKERNTVPAIDALRIDIGVDSREEAEAMVSLGDAVYFVSDYTPLENGLFKAKALDDRVGCAMLLKLAQTQPEYDVTLVFTVQEEVGLRGAAVAGNTLQPEYAIAVDATTAGDTAGVAEDKQVCLVGNGPVVSFMDRRTVYDHELYTRIRRLAEEHGIPAQTKTLVAGGNDAGSFQTAGVGAKVAAISLPCRYIHSPSCVLSETDVENTYRLLELLMNTLPAGEAE